MEKFAFSLEKSQPSKLKNYVVDPREKSKLESLLYPFHRSYPHKVLSKYRWFQNSRLPSLMPSLNKRKKWLTVINRLGAPGDTLITANVIRCIKRKVSKLRVNCITPHDELIQLDPILRQSIYAKHFIPSTPPIALIVRKERPNIIEHNMLRLGIKITL